MPHEKNIEPLDEIQRNVWDARLPLEIKLAESESRSFDKSQPYLISVPRLSYLPFLSRRLLDYFSDELITDVNEIDPDKSYFTFENVPLKWHLPVGLLYDLHVLSTQDVAQDAQQSNSPNSRAQAFPLMVHFTTSSEAEMNIVSSSPAIVNDAFINSVKEADFLRSGSAKPIMSLNAADSKLLWTSTEDNDLTAYARIYAGLMPRDAPWRYIPLRVYLPSASDDTETEDEAKVSSSNVQGQIKVIQSQIQPFVATSSISAGQMRLPASSQSSPQTIGTALHTLLPSLFPSRRTPIIAKPLLHGAVVPMNAVLEEVASKACYADGWHGRCEDEAAEFQEKRVPRHRGQSWHPRSRHRCSEHKQRSHTINVCLDSEQSGHQIEVYSYEFFSSSCPSLETPNITLSYMSEMPEDPTPSRTSDPDWQDKQHDSQDVECQTDLSSGNMEVNRYAFLQPGAPPGGSKKRYVKRKKGKASSAGGIEGDVQGGVEVDQNEVCGSEEIEETVEDSETSQPKQVNKYADDKVKPTTDALTLAAYEFLGDDMKPQAAIRFLSSEKTRLRDRIMLSEQLIQALEKLESAVGDERATWDLRVVVLKAQWKAGL